MNALKRKISIVVLFLLPLVPAVRAAETATDLVPVPDSITAQGVPPIPRQNVEGLLPYENIRTASLLDWHPAERRLLIRTRFGESAQLHEVAMPMGARTQLTFYREPAGEGRYRPGAPHQVLYSLDQGGAENFQLFLLDRKTGKSQRFTDGEHRHISPLWSRDGQLLAFSANVRNGRDMDLYVADPSRPGSDQRLGDFQGSWAPLDWSPDNRRLLAVEYISANESYLHWVDLASRERHAVTPRVAGAEPVAYLGGVWSADGKAVYTATDKDSEFMRMVRIDLASGKQQVLSGSEPWDVEEYALSQDGKVLAWFLNEDGVSRLRLLDTQTGASLPSPSLPAGSVNNLLFRPGSHEVAFALSWARSPSDVYSYDPGSKRLDRWTASEVGGLDPESFVLPELVRYSSFDQRKIPAWVYRPAKERFPGKRPVYVSIHGGPEGQSRPSFLSSTNFLLDLGVAVIYPNVRGSTGYGKTYLKLDNGRLREDSVKDIGALLDWIATQPDLDSSRVMVAGGSYGGYMVLAALTFYSDRLCCAWDSVGISNFVTFLENTQEYRRDLRRIEYGDERDPEMKAFLQEIAPLNRVERITRPLMVSQGANDPRVPLQESNQITAAVRAKGLPVWYLIGKDEGHGFQKKSNLDYQRAVLLEFIRTFLLKEEGTAAGR